MTPIDDTNTKKEPLSGDLIPHDVPTQHGVDFSAHSVTLSPQDNNDPTRNPALSYLLTLGSKRSRDTMRSFLAIIANKLGCRSVETCPWQSLTRQHVQAVMDALSMDESTPRAPSTLNTYLAAIKGVALEARTMRSMDTDTYLDIKSIKRVRGYRLPKGRSLDESEIEALLSLCEADSSPKGVRDNALFKVMLGCGLRREEVVSLSYPTDVDWRRLTLRVRGKGNKERLVFMPKETARALRSWVNDELQVSLADRLQERPVPLFVRVRRHGKMTPDRLTPPAIFRILTARSVEAGIMKVAPHDLRRTFATSMLDTGVDLLTLQRLMGHSSLETTKQYDKRGEDAMARAMEGFRMF